MSRQSALAGSLLRPAERVRGQIRARLADQEAKYHADIASAAENLSRTEAEVIQARAHLAEAREREAAARFDYDQLTGARLLRRYLSERAASTEYGQYLDAVALSHRDLRDLEDYLRKAASDADAASVDRIILYIDDLDRCPPATVVRAMEAVNLLLSLPLFVVVIGVDPRWLLESLENIHAQLQPEPPARQHASASDYLDKIFQLSYQIPAMTADTCAELLEHTALSIHVEDTYQHERRA